VPEAAHAQALPVRARRKAARHVDAGIEHACAARKRVHGDAQLRLALDHPIPPEPRHARSFPGRSFHCTSPGRLSRWRKDGNLK